MAATVLGGIHGGHRTCWHFQRRIWRRMQGVKDMAGNTVKEKIAAGARIVDVRTPAEFKDGAYDGAINIPISSLLARMRELEPKDAPIVLYCASGARSGQGARLLRQAGFTDVINAGGLDDMPE
jgi:phage shock protein E